MNLKELDDFLDPQSENIDAVLAWVNERIDAIRNTDFTPEILNTFTSIELKEDLGHPFGAEASANWRRFFIATLLADWASYEKPVDRADFARLKYIMTSAYPYTRVWGCRLADGKFTPVGYTMWYPIAKFVYDGVLKNQSDVNDRGIILPLRFANPESIRYAYVFNISITKELFNTPCSLQLIHSLQNEAAQRPNVSSIIITVSAEGRKFAEMLDFVPAGKVTVQGETEDLYVRHSIS